MPGRGRHEPGGLMLGKGIHAGQGAHAPRHAREGGPCQAPLHLTPIPNPEKILRVPLTPSFKVGETLKVSSDLSFFTYGVVFCALSCKNSFEIRILRLSEKKSILSR